MKPILPLLQRRNQIWRGTWCSVGEKFRTSYHVRDLQLNYQYGPFGVPGLGLKRGLIEDVVVAPYATILYRISQSL